MKLNCSEMTALQTPEKLRCGEINMV